MQAFIRNIDPLVRRFIAGGITISELVYLMRWMEGIVAGYLEAYDADLSYHQWVEWAYPVERDYTEAMGRALAYPLEMIELLDKLGG